MAYFLHDNHARLSRKGYTVFLAFFWVFGLICGILIYLSADDSLVSLMRSAPSGAVSIVGLLCVVALPFLLSAAAVLLSQPWLLFLICFGKAMQFSFSSIGVMHAWCGAGWLIRSLLFFSNCTALPLLYWFWLRCTPEMIQPSFTEVFVLLSVIMLIGSVDYCIISPFLAGMILL